MTNTPPAAPDTAPAGSTGNTPGTGETPPSADDLRALREQADRRMQERNAARDEAKAYKDLGLTVDEIKALKDARDAANGGPTEEQIRAAAQRDADKAANERIATRARTSAVREQAASLGFHQPKDALALLDRDELAKVTVGDDDEADGAAVKKLLEDLVKARPYLVKAGTASARDAGIGAAGSGARPDPGPGTARMAAAYAEHAAASR